MHEIIEEKDKAEKCIDKVNNCNFDFTINIETLRKENLLALLKPKIHRAGLHMLLEKNALTDECKSLIKNVLESMDQPNKKPNKKRKTGGKQLTIEAAFKMSNNDASNNLSNESIVMMMKVVMKMNDINTQQIVITYFTTNIQLQILFS